MVLSQCAICISSLSFLFFLFMSCFDLSLLHAMFIHFITSSNYKLRWVCLKKLCYIDNQQFILVACSFSVLSSSSLLFLVIHLFRVVSRLSLDFFFFCFLKGFFWQRS
ncbi:hypothetical protein ACE6H2_014984 [Prunus campanulata]